MKFASWNINSINLRKETVLNWVIENSIDVLGLQEIKCENEKFPTDFFHEKGYFTEVIGQKSYNGVAIISKHPIQLSKSCLPSLKEEEHQVNSSQEQTILMGFHG